VKRNRKKEGYPASLITDKTIAYYSLKSEWGEEKLSRQKHEGQEERVEKNRGGKSKSLEGEKKTWAVREEKGKEGCETNALLQKGSIFAKLSAGHLLKPRPLP